MAYDGIMMHQVIDALNKTITGGRINKIYQISKYELLIPSLEVLTMKVWKFIR